MTEKNLKEIVLTPEKRYEISTLLAELQKNHKILRVLAKTSPHIISEIENQNEEILINLCKLDLEARIGKGFHGIYPYAGDDIDLIYQLGGNWLVVEPSPEKRNFQSYEDRIREITKYGNQGLNEGRIKITHSPILNFYTPPEHLGSGWAFVFEKINPIPRIELSKEIREYIPDILMLKNPGLGKFRGYEEVEEFFEEFITTPTLMITNELLTSKNVEEIRNLIGVPEQVELKSGKEGIFGGSLYHFTNFRMYIVHPK